METVVGMEDKCNQILYILDKNHGSISIICGLYKGHPLEHMAITTWNDKTITSN